MEKGADYIREALERREDDIDASLRPSGFDSFTGQPKTVERLKVMVGAAAAGGTRSATYSSTARPGSARRRSRSFSQTRWARQIRVTSGPVIEKASDLAGLLTNLQEGDILFIDEIHRISRTVEEFLYGAMEDFRIDIMIDQGPNARSVRLNVPKFTLIGATTRTGLLTSPLRSRFTLQTRLDYYSRKDLVAIVERTCGLLEVPIDAGGAEEIARRARGTPRIVNNLVRFVRDYAQERADGKITRKCAVDALELLEIDSNGLDEMDKRMLRAMAQNYNGGPVGMGTIAVAVNEEPDTLEEVHEPYLIQEGFIRRTPQGRVMTEKAWEALGLQSGGAQGKLF